MVLIMLTIWEEAVTTTETSNLYVLCKWELQNKIAHFFYIYKFEFHFFKIAIKATNKTATTHNKIFYKHCTLTCDTVSVILIKQC